jgi:hypothetical protein
LINGFLRAGPQKLPGEDGGDEDKNYDVKPFVDEGRVIS